ncbi:MAG: aminoglycoside 6-adenylyltransferase [Butyrivibrio sp.]|nr:aminoglycoside 6-adenylyltransferase [Butyrivibrio sp.]
MDKFFEIKGKILESANSDEDIKAIISIGSSTRSDMKADEYSDLDLFIVTTNTEPWYSGEYPKRFGNVSISFIEDTLGGGKERRCIYDEDKDVDMIPLTPEQFETVVKDGVAQWVMNRGYDVLYDVMNCTDLLKEHISCSTSTPSMSSDEFSNMINDFYFHNIWAYKKLKRGEIWAAKMNVDAYLKWYLLRMIELYCYKANNTDVWHDGRFVDKWADKDILAELEKCFAHYNAEDILSALRNTHKLFARITRKIAQIEGYEYPENAEKCAGKYLEL